MTIENQIRLLLLDLEFDLVQNHREIGRRQFQIGQLQEEREQIEKALVFYRDYLEKIKEEN